MPGLSAVAAGPDRDDDRGTAAPAAPVPPAAQPEPGSVADLRLRLERLPLGHPSSPYHVDGERKPPPPRLKHLELAPPEPGRAAPWFAAGSLPGADEIGPDAAASSGPHTEVQDLDGSATSAPEGSQAYGSGADHLGTDGVGARPDWERRWAVSAEPDDESHLVTAARADSAWTADSAPDADRAPDVDEAPDGTGDAPDRRLAGAFDGAQSGPRQNARRADTRLLGAPRTEADGSWTWGSIRLSRDLVRAADDAFDQFSEAEGRNLFGGFRSDGLTARLLDIGAMLDHGHIAPGSEQHALLEPDVFRARFAELLRRHPERTPEQLARRVPGALSYSFLLDAEHYSAGIWTAQDVFEAQGFQLLARKNGWGSTENRCVFTVWRDPESALPFQVQFHTSASFEAQQLARTSAALINDPRIPAAETENLRSDLASAWAALPAPPGQASIGDFRRDRRPPPTENGRLDTELRPAERQPAPSERGWLDTDLRHAERQPAPSERGWLDTDQHHAERRRTPSDRGWLSADQHPDERRPPDRSTP